MLYVPSGQNTNRAAGADPLGDLLGKVLRLKRDGTAPGDNPYGDRAPLVWQEQAAHDQAQITGVDPGDLRGELPADILHLPREALRIARPSPAGPVAPGRGALFQAATAPAFTTHFRCVHPASITQALGFLHSG